MCVNEKDPGATARLQEVEIRKVEDLKCKGSTAQSNGEGRREEICKQVGRGGERCRDDV